MPSSNQGHHIVGVVVSVGVVDNVGVGVASVVVGFVAGVPTVVGGSDVDVVACDVGVVVGVICDINI